MRSEKAPYSQFYLIRLILYIMQISILNYIRTKLHRESTNWHSDIDSSPLLLLQSGVQCVTVIQACFGV